MKQAGMIDPHASASTGKHGRHREEEESCNCGCSDCPDKNR